uniref:SFRICE_026656 n=1 Tax=Spodoptera frugiperda TaxID=7108 RepID=A0A2H1VTL3_SPOFR
MLSIVITVRACGRRARVAHRPNRTRPFVRAAHRVPRAPQRAIRPPQMGPSRADAWSGAADYLAGLPGLRLEKQEKERDCIATVIRYLILKIILVIPSYTSSSAERRPPLNKGLPLSPTRRTTSRHLHPLAPRQSDDVVGLPSGRSAHVASSGLRSPLSHLPRPTAISPPSVYFKDVVDADDEARQPMSNL